MQILLHQGIATRRSIMCSLREELYLNASSAHNLRQSERKIS